MERYDSYKDSGVEWIGQIPSDWECIRLGMLGDFSSSGIDKKSNEDETPVKMVNYTDIIQSRKYYPIQTGEKEYMRVTTPQSKFEEHKLERGDMVFIPSSETHEDLGYSSLIDFDEEDIVYSYHILRYKTKKPVFHYYKKYLINHHSVLNQFSSECKGTTRQIIGRDVFNNVRVVLPPISEQQQIVSFLDTKTSLIDSLIEKTQRKIELLKEKRTSLINEVVTKGLNPNVEMKDSGVEWIGEIPIHWELKKIKHLKSSEKYSLVDGPFGSNLKSIHYVDDGDVYVIESGFITSGKFKYVRKFKTITEEHFETIKRSQCKEGDIIISKIGEYYGMSGILPKLDKKSVISGNSISLTLNKDTNTEFIHQVLIQHRINGTFKKEVQQTGQPFISLGVINNLVIPTPDLNEQQQIVEYLDEQTGVIDKTISIEEKRIELLKEYRQSLISEVVTGKRKVV